MKEGIYLFMVVTSVIGVLALAVSIWLAKRTQPHNKNHCHN